MFNSRRYLYFEDKPVRIEDHQSKQLIGKTISMVKVGWDDKSINTTREIEVTIRETYPYLFSVKSIFEDKNFSCWKECKDLKNSFGANVVHSK